MNGYQVGAFVELEGYHGLAQAINYLLTNPEIMERLGKAAKERAEKYFSLDRMVEDVIRTYRDIQR